jgi:F420-dependent oxidoreductase-like protein
MDLRIFVEPQEGASYDDQLAGARLAEQLGFDAYFRSDHFLTMSGDGLPGPTDSWITLAGLARETSTIRLGTLVSSATFRHPSVLAVSVAQVDAMSNGRVELGLGTGWFEAEHRALGIPFPSKRFDRFDEQLQIISGLWSTPSGQTFSFEGEHYRLAESPALPKPVQQPIPIIIGGRGANRTPALAARFASEFNIGFTDEQTIATRFAGVRAACEAIGRDPESILYSVALPALIGRDENDYLRRAAVRDADPAQFREHNIAGTASEAIDKIGRLAGLGASRVYLQTAVVQDLEQIELLGTEVLPRVA